MSSFLQDPEAVTKTVAIASAMFLTYHGARKGTSVAGNYVASKLGRPALVRETSRRSYLSPRDYWRRATGTYRAHETRGLNEIVLGDDEAERVETLAASVRCAKEHNLPHRHLLLYGPPGTGKTMLGRVLAYESGMDYAIMTGGDVAPLGRDAVTELHNLFDWARRSKRGVVLFMDEADAFLRALRISHKVHSVHELGLPSKCGQLLTLTCSGCFARHL
jgi:ATPase family AAA domain-containing protein 3A/B